MAVIAKPLGPFGAFAASKRVQSSSSLLLGGVFLSEQDYDYHYHCYHCPYYQLLLVLSLLKVFWPLGYRLAGDVNQTAS